MAAADDPKPSNKAQNQNRLARERSPYLRQHADNPVDWYPWGDEAFEKAKELDRPVFLSIGYATCHWCHVMEHESFEDPEVARLMNEAFINVKVDREERPDIDQVYMTVCQMMTGSGGWPLTIIMTPDRRPFFSATYIPRQSMYGRIGMMELVPKVSDLWAQRREDLETTADTLVQHLRSAEHTQAGTELGSETVKRAIQELSARYDAENGGFGGAPKFPSPHNLLLLLRQSEATGNEKTLEMVEHTLQAMRRGGIFDHIGFGFHRYSTDREWLVPHFEKMLYDQAMMVLAYAEAFAVTGKKEYADIAREVLTYVLRDMTSPEGAFFSAEDADSEGEEGKFYVWSADEIKALAGDDASVALKHWGVQAEGNFVEETGSTLTGANIPHLSSETPYPPHGDAAEKIERIRDLLFEHREGRIHPLKDDKVLADWNGLMASAFARAGRVFGEEQYVEAAARAVEFVRSSMRNSDGRVLHRFHSGDAAIPGFLDDYAFLTWAEIELYRATLAPEHLERAVVLQEATDRLYWDEEGGGYFFSAADNEELLVRQKEIYDGAMPSGNSVAMHNLVSLSRLTGRPEFAERARKLSAAFGAEISRLPSGHSWTVQAIAHASSPSLEIVICGGPGEPETDNLLEIARDAIGLDDALLLLPTGPTGDSLRKIAPFTEYYTPIDDKAAAYVCRDFHCELPTSDPDRLVELILEVDSGS